MLTMFNYTVKVIILLRLLYLDYVGISTKTTNFAATNGGSIDHLDRHYPLCPSNSFIRGFKIEASNTDIRYVYDCLELKKTFCSSSVLHGSNEDFGSGNMDHIDRFPADCGTYGYMFGFLFERYSGVSFRYHVHCCTVSGEWTSAMSCYTGVTGFNDNGGGRLFFIDRHQVWCNTGYALSYFKYENNGDYTQIRLHYRCCKIYPV